MDHPAPPPAGARLPPARPFRPAFGLRSAFMQSILATQRPAVAIWRRRGVDLGATATRHVLDCGDGVRLVGYLNRQTAAARALVVLIHGWEGSHESSYLYSMACALFQAGHDVFRLNLRDHGGTHDLNEKMFHSARIGEVLGAIARVQKLSPVRPLFVVGFSLGGNFSLRVGLHGPACGIAPALCVGISPVVHPHRTLEAIDGGPRIFHGYFVSKWRKTLEAKARAWPGRFDFSGQRPLKSFVEMTRQFVKDHTEYEAVEDYFAAYTLTPSLLRGSPTPLAIITSRDDSVIPVKDFDGIRVDGAVAAYDLHDRGGHCGFVEGWSLEAWTERRVLQLFEAAAE